MQTMQDVANHSSSIPFDCLLRLIGQRLHRANRIYTVIEVLPEGPCLVLEDRFGPLGIQENQHGEPLRRSPNVVSLPVYLTGGKTINPELGELIELLPNSRD